MSFLVLEFCCFHACMNLKQKYCLESCKWDSVVITFVLGESIKPYRRKYLFLRLQCHATAVNVTADISRDGQVLL